MFKPEIYQKSNAVPRQDALACLQKYAASMNWRPQDSIIDLGCGDGGVTMEILQKFLPKDYKTLVGCDIGKKMVQHARNKYGDDRNSFVVWEMSSPVPQEFIGNFNHVFSFYAMHWVQEQQRLFKNIYELLSKDGDCLLAFLGYTSVYDFYRALVKHETWGPWLVDAEDYISPYQDCQNPEKRVQQIMENAGFNNIVVRCEEKEYVYDGELFRRTMESICPFKIPADLHEQFMDDYMQVVRDMGLMDTAGDQTLVTVNYNLLIATATKN